MEEVRGGGGLASKIQLETLLDLAKERNNNKILKLNIIKTN